MTLVELLVVVILIAILASMALAGLAIARRRVRIDSTRNTIRKIHEIVMPQYESYLGRRVSGIVTGTAPPLPGTYDVFTIYADQTTQPPTYYGPRLPDGSWPPIVGPTALPNAIARSRLQILRALQIFEMPDSWDDVCASTAEVLRGDLRLSYSGSSTAIVSGTSEFFSPSYARTGPVLSYAACRQSLPVSGTTTNGSAECLYMLVARGGFEPDVMEQFRGDEIGDTDRDGAPEFIDAWGRPIQFIRWAPGISRNPDGSAVSSVPNPSPVQIADALAYHDPLDPARVDMPASTAPPNATGYSLLPLIYSEGPDGVPSSLIATGSGGWRRLLVRGASGADPLPLRSIISGNNNGSPPSPAAAPAVRDNITNHDMMTK